jgi:hypothetical protein
MPQIGAALWIMWKKLQNLERGERSIRANLEVFRIAVIRV